MYTACSPKQHGSDSRVFFLGQRNNLCSPPDDLPELFKGLYCFLICKVSFRLLEIIELYQMKQIVDGAAATNLHETSVAYRHTNVLKMEWILTF